MYDSTVFSQRLYELRKQRWEQYKHHQNIYPNPYERFECCKSQESLADKIDVERRTISKWESGDSMPTIDKIASLCNILECTIDYLFDNETLIGLPDAVLASHYSGISVDIIEYGQRNDDYLQFLNHFMHPDNCSALINSTTLVAWKAFLTTKNLDDIFEPLKTCITDAFHKYQALTSINEYSKENYKQYILSALPPEKITFSPRKSDERINIKNCISTKKFNELGLSSQNSNSYPMFIKYIVDYSYEAFTTQALIDIQKEKIGKTFIRLLEKYLLEE